MMNESMGVGMKINLLFIPNNSSELYAWKIKQGNKAIGSLYLSNGACALIGNTTYAWSKISNIKDAKIALEKELKN